MHQAASNPADEVVPLPAELPCTPIGHPDNMMSKESVRKAVEEFRVRPTDIIVSTFAKTGTTLVTWLCHLLRTGANVDFESMETMYEVVPWPMLSWDIGFDPNVDGSQFFPRVFKSHLRMASVHRGCKYIVTVRDPATTAISFFNFFLAKQVPIATSMDVSSFLMKTPFIQGREGRASIWEYYQEYHILKSCPSVLVLVYEDLVKNKEDNIHRIADFMGIGPVTPELMAKILAMSTKEFMAQHMTLFDEPYERAKKLGRAGDLSQLAPGAKVAVQTHSQKFNDEALEFLHQKWDEYLKPLGYDTYQDFAECFRDANERRFGTT
jgi:hypothetical protein